MIGRCRAALRSDPVDLLADNIIESRRMDFATKTASSLIAILVLSTGVVSQSPAVVQNPTEQSANSRIAAINEANRLIMQIQELCKKGKCNSALPLAKRAVDLRQTTLGDHFETAWALKVLAYVYS